MSGQVEPGRSASRLPSASKARWKRWEAGDTEPLPWLRPKLARILKVSREQLDAYLDEATLAPTTDDTASPYAVELGLPPTHVTVR